MAENIIDITIAGLVFGIILFLMGFTWLGQKRCSRQQKKAKKT
jgi:hypothetical protein